MEGRAAAKAAARPFQTGSGAGAPFGAPAPQLLFLSAAEGLPSAALPIEKECQSLLKRSHAFVKKPETGKAASMMQTMYKICCIVKATFPQPV